MKVLVTGNLGYIGSVLTPILVNKGYDVRGYDANFYEGLVQLPNEFNQVEQIIKDIRNVSENDVEGCQAVIHLAALSNDPLGEFDTKLTREINYEATLKLATVAKRVGVTRFIYASSQSMYGVNYNNEEISEDSVEMNPQTSYAKTKWEAELELKDLNSKEFCTTNLRLSTVFGRSPKLRSDIVFNNLVACAYTTGRIEIKTDGSPWRPVIDVRDATAAFIAGLESPPYLIAGDSFNVGVKNGNYTIKQLAEAAQKLVPGSDLVFTGEMSNDQRSYKVSFSKILTRLKGYYEPRWNLETGGKDLVDFFKEIAFNEESFRGTKTNRLQRLRFLVDHGIIDNEFFVRQKSSKERI